MGQNKKSRQQEPFNFRRAVSSFLPLSTNCLLIRDISDRDLGIIRGWFSSDERLWKLYYHHDKTSFSDDQKPCFFWDDFKKIKGYTCLAVIVEDKLIGEIELFYYAPLEKSCYFGFIIQSKSKYSYLLLADLLFLLAKLLFECLVLNCVYITVAKNNKKLIRLVKSWGAEIFPRTTSSLNSLELEFKINREPALKKKYEFTSYVNSKSGSILLKSLLKN